MSADSSDALKGVPPQTGTISTAINTTTGGISTVHTPHHISQFDADIIGQKIIIDANPPDNIMLKSKKLCIERPEQLAVLDFQAVSQGDFLDSEDKNTKLFNERVLKRNMQLDSVVASMNSAADADPDNYEIAMTQYESALAAAAAEVALLKVAYTFKVYAKVGPSWTSFVKNYSFDVTEFLGSDTEVDATDFGKNFSDYMNGTMYWANLGTTIEDAVTAGKDASLFLQLLLDLSFSCAFCTPQNALSS
ncbi:MAG TPA: hypothetical protein EYF95_00980, partial [Flavobacteriales bacterium]|nr:hypothetical protein [Flavobacteriales bacterium]